ncbi:uncharacterized protein ASPGLDRAFT_59136 [Aspergillus glaucus CBS 516.65]|uniref:Ent-kaurene synthase n=1 Tax=Aspergillus glaucus CBS 516.65 TaxID=1160497 RepID=A0A1L9VFN8_ASPGL|nr:hypothetical protein ASPGLDRAFT_59136 [Aspergillus glaucus CBS 516.65]OJJ82720.1 hypothetical protein ASPGLDRAFT_59136 [Aspergillus glaucus CBS 516.65]
MLAPNTTSLSTQASRLVRQLISDNGDVGFMSCAIYDTAWVSMVSKPTANGPQWLFPECFEYILQSQQPDGGWETYASDIDGILNTAASLLALKTHAEYPIPEGHAPASDLERRIDLASTALSHQLQSWDVPNTVHVGFEIILPTILRLLEKKGLRFEFVGWADLDALNALKLFKFKPQYLYSSQKFTALHSLESFIDIVDFDKVSHHKESGAFMASPSSTAAYLMHASSWDNECEEYLRTVVQNGSGQGNGGVPSAYPSTYFEITWVLTTLLHNGFMKEDLGIENTNTLYEKLHLALLKGNGIIGFAPSLQADADDTAKALISVSMLGDPVPATGLLSEFEGKTHFRTYQGERDPSFTANCNALLALLSQPDLPALAPQIEKATTFLCDTWWEADGHIGDKWNLSPHYPSMLMAEAFGSLLEAWGKGSLDAIPSELIRDKVSITLYQALLRALQTQNEDGSWGPSHRCEETAYAVLTIANACGLPFLDSLWPEIDEAVDCGRNFLQGTVNEKPEYIWVEKVTYSSLILSDCYVLAALKVDHQRSQSSDTLSQLFYIPEKKISEFVRFYSMIPLFAKMPRWKLRAALIEGYLFLPQLSEKRLEIFPRTEMEEDKYFEYIPFTWTACNNRDNTFVCNKTLKEMMIISFLNYQADEFMEAVVGRYYSGKDASVVACIGEIFDNVDSSSNEGSDSDGNTAKPVKPVKKTPTIEQLSNDKAASKKVSDNVAGVLDSFIQWSMNHPSVREASTIDALRVKDELETFLIAHMEQTEDSENFAAQAKHNREIFTSPRSSFYRWVNSTSSNHTSCPYSFAFYQTLLASEHNQPDCFQTPEEKYIAEGMGHHLAVMCRMYNDYGSIARDRDEENLNSVNFPEFASAGSDKSSKSDEARRKALFTVAEYERANMEFGLSKLRELAGEDKRKTRVIEKIQMFCNVTDLYGQIYVARDIASRM